MLHLTADVTKTGNGERGTGNGERRTGNGERGTGNGERGTGNGERGTGNGERGTGNGERGTGNGERGTGNGERGTGNGERGTGVWERVYRLRIQNGGGNDVYVMSCMYFRMIPAVIKCLDDQQSRELRRIRTTCSTVYLYDIVNKYR